MREPALGRLYRFFYGVGLYTRRLFRRARRHLLAATAPARRRVKLFWRVKVTRPLRRRLRRARAFFAAFPHARHELAAEAKKGVWRVFPCLWKQLRRGCRHYREELLTLWSLVGPAAAAIVLIVTVGRWMNTDFCLTLNYRGQNLGCIASETIYESAAGMAKSRVINVDNTFSVEAVPDLTVTMQGANEVLDDAALCDAILRTEGDSIAEANGLYVDGAFIGAMESANEMNAMLEGLKDGYCDKNDKNQRAEFIQKTEIVEGLFPSATVVDAFTLRSKLTAQAVVEKTYTAQPGDSLIAIAVKNNMTLAELRAMNEQFQKSDMIHIGDVVTVQRPQSFLQVKVIKRIEYTETIAFSTQYVNNTKQPVTYSKVKTKGVDGKQNVVAEITYIDGMETSRTVISKTVTKQPVTKVIERGTQKVKTQGGKTVVVGDGVTTGSMIWPVPICTSMSRGYKRGHYGIDICNGPVTVKNKPAYAADGGVVVMAGWQPSWGRYVRIQHANGLMTGYAHLNSISVVKGQTVSKGQKIGLIGSTGNSSGPHLHFEVWRNGARVNPLNYVRPVVNKANYH